MLAIASTRVISGSRRAPSTRRYRALPPGVIGRRYRTRQPDIIPAKIGYPAGRVRCAGVRGPPSTVRPMRVGGQRIIDAKSRPWERTRRPATSRTCSQSRTRASRTGTAGASDRVAPGPGAVPRSLLRGFRGRRSRARSREHRAWPPTPTGARMRRRAACAVLYPSASIAAATSCAAESGMAVAASSRTSSRAPGISCAIASPFPTGKKGSRRPWTTSAGILMSWRRLRQRG